MSAGIKANNDGSAAIQVGGTDYITISSTGAVAMPVSLTIAGQPAGGNYALQSYAAPATWSKPAGLKAVKVTVVGAGGAGGTVPTGASAGGGGGGGGAAIEYIPAPSIPGPVAVTAGPGTNSFGAFCSATAGANGGGGSGNNAGGAGGVGSGGTFNVGGGGGGSGHASGPLLAVSGIGGPSILGGGGQGVAVNSNVNTSGIAGRDYGGGGSGGIRLTTGTGPGGSGAPGVVIVEEFY